jgi:hypothetical protein
MTPWHCSFCAAAGMARIGYPARTARFPNGDLVREAATWLACDPCAADIDSGHVDDLLIRMIGGMSARRPDLFAPDDPHTLHAAVEIVRAFRDAATGTRVEIDLPIAVPEDAPPQLREGIARRRLVEIEGRCPCGARVSQPPRRERRRAARAGDPLVSVIRHRSNCPADARTYDRLMADWSARTA